PVVWNFQRGAGLPGAIAHPLRSDGRVRLNCSFKRAKPEHTPCSIAAIKAHPVNLEREWRRWIGADVEADALAGADAGPRAIAFNPRASILGRWINARLAQQPVTRTALVVFTADKILGHLTSGPPCRRAAWEERDSAQAKNAFQQHAPCKSTKRRSCAGFG